MSDVPTTPIYKLNLIPFDRRNYQDLLNGNFSLLEAVIAQFVSVNNLIGTWTNSTSYLAGDRVVDVATSQIWSCNVNHISPVLPTTFAQDRTNNPARWTIYNFAVENRGTWAAGIAYHPNDWVVNGYQFAVCITAHTSTNFTNDVNAARWIVAADLTQAVTDAAAYATTASQYASALHGTSSNSLAISTTTLGFSTQLNRQWLTGDRVRLSSQGTPLANMDGTLTSFNAATGTGVVVTDVTGAVSGTFTDWNINLTGQRGATGPTGATGTAGAPGSTAYVYSARSSNTILTAADTGKMIDVTSGTYTQTFTACASLLSTFAIGLRNSGTGIVTLDPNGAETIDGRTTVNVYPGESFVISCDASALRTIGRQGKGARVLVSETTGVGPVATADFAIPTDTELDSFEFEFVNVSCAAAVEQLQFRVQNAGGLITASYYEGRNQLTSAAMSQTFENNIGFVTITCPSDNSVRSSFSGFVKVPGHNHATLTHAWYGISTGGAAGNPSFSQFGGGFDSAVGAIGPITNFRLQTSTGANMNIAIARILGTRQ